MSLAANLATAGMTVVALALGIIALRAWWLTRQGKLGWILVGFGLFVVKGVFFSVLLFTEPAWESEAMVPGLALDTAALAAFYVAVFHGG